jgi:hypothetical protein
MKTAGFYKSVIAIVLTSVVGAASPVESANYLKDISVQKAGDTAVVIISTTKADQYNVFLTDGKPERIVIDLQGVTNSWTVKRFMELPFKSIQSIRTSQYRTTPVLETRVVLDIGRPIDFREFRKGDDIIIKIPVIEGEADFPGWHVTGKSAPRAVKKTAEATKKQKAKAPSKKTTAGVKFESYPKRKLVRYRTTGFRDPFVSLVGGVTGMLSSSLPVLENLRLVGILEDIDGNRALLEDSEGNGYILVPNDKIKNGYLVSVTNKKAIFQITEYGWTRTVALDLKILELE